MISNMKPPKRNAHGIRWFESKWSYVPRLKTDLGKFLEFTMWLRVLIEANGGAKSTGETSGNRFNGISPINPNRQNYINAANKEFRQ
jgi:hypothetical protein